jgi:hypothetical protein
MTHRALWLLLALCGDASASPDACIKSPVNMTREAKVIVVARPVGAKLVVLPGKKVRRGEYAVSSVIRGAKTQKVVVETSCLDEEMPMSAQGYPAAQRYCPNSLDLPGFTTWAAKPGRTAQLVLFLTDKSELVDPTSFASCDATPWPSSIEKTIELVKKLAKP